MAASQWRGGSERTVRELPLLWVTSIRMFLVEPLLKPFSRPATR